MWEVGRSIRQLRPRKQERKDFQRGDGKSDLHTDSPIVETMYFILCADKGVIVLLKHKKVF